MPPCLAYLLVLVALTACGGGDDATDAPADAMVAADAALACDVAAIPPFELVDTTTLIIAPSGTARGGETIRDTLQGQLKRHQIALPTDEAARNGKLFVWMSGSGAEPANYDTILHIAAAAGYVAVSLAYDNETSVAEICGVPGDPVCGNANPDCEGDVRDEMVYGASAHDSPCVDIPDADAIEHRILRLLQYAADDGSTDVSPFLSDDETELEWANIAVGGWSQGGGHAAILARDHLVARAVYASKGGDSALCPAVEPDVAACDLDGDGVVTSGNMDELLVPSPWTSEPRATPGGRQFGAIHGGEDAMFYSPEVFERFGMGAKGDHVELDAAGDDYAAYACGHVFVTHATPACGANDFHKSMALDACLAIGDDGLPVLGPFYYYALTVPVD